MNFGTVMVVEDEEIMRETVIEMLEERAEKVIPAESGDVALASISEVRDAKSA